MARVLFWSPNYAPELTGIPPLVTDAAEWFAARGHVVDVVTAFPNYPERRIHDGFRRRVWTRERRNGVDVLRSWLRVRPRERFRDKALYEATFTAASAPRAARRIARADVTVVVVPCLSAAVAAALLKLLLRLVGRRTRLVLWVQDLVIPAAGALELGRVARILLGGAGVVERFAARRADQIVVCSPGFARYLTARGVDASKIETIYNWVDSDWIKPSPRSGNGATRFLYAGNLGYSQGFETLLEAARTAGPGVEVDIVGEGNAATRVRELAAATTNVHVTPPVPNDEFPLLLAGHDAHVVVQRRVSGGANLPSKINSYLASGRPIVASIDPDTPAADLLRRSGGAILVPPESPARLAEAMSRLEGDRALCERLGEEGRAFALRALGKEPQLETLEWVVLG